MPKVCMVAYFHTTATSTTVTFSVSIIYIYEGPYLPVSLPFPQRIPLPFPYNISNSRYTATTQSL